MTWFWQCRDLNTVWAGIELIIVEKEFQLLRMWYSWEQPKLNGNVCKKSCLQKREAHIGSKYAVGTVYVLVVAMHSFLNSKYIDKIKNTLISKLFF